MDHSELIQKIMEQDDCIKTVTWQLLDGIEYHTKETYESKKLGKKVERFLHYSKIEENGEIKGHRLQGFDDVEIDI